MKKKIIKIVSIILLFAVGLLLIWNLTDCATICVADKKFRLSFADSWNLRVLLSPEEYGFGTYGCPFSEGYSIQMGGLTYCIAQDDCPSVYIPELNIYYSISRNDIKELHNIMSSYQ